MRQNVCPACGERVERVPLMKGDGVNRLYRCPICSGVFRGCEFKRLTPEERASRPSKQMTEQERERERARWRDGYNRRKGEINTRRRLRYARDGEFRRRESERKKEYYAENRDELLARKKKWISEHRELHNQYCKRSRLRKSEKERHPSELEAE